MRAVVVLLLLVQVLAVGARYRRSGAGAATEHADTSTGAASDAATVAAKGEERQQTNASETASVEASAETRVDTFRGWLVQGGATGDWAVNMTNEGRLAIFTKRPFRAGELILAVPSALMLTEEVAWSSELATVLRHEQLGPLFGSANYPHAKLILCLLHEVGRGEGSFFSPFLRVLPSSSQLLSPVFYTQRQLKMLNGSHVTHDISALHSYIDELHALFANASALLPELVPARDFTRQSVRWALAIILRGTLFRLLPEGFEPHALIPAIGLLRPQLHPSLRKVDDEGALTHVYRRELDGGGEQGSGEGKGRATGSLPGLDGSAGFRFSALSQRYELYADRSYDGGEEVGFSLGSRRSRELLFSSKELLLSGCSLEGTARGNPYDVIKFEANPNEGQDPLHGEKSTLLQSYVDATRARVPPGERASAEGIADEESSCGGQPCFRGSGRVPDSTMLWARVLSLTQADVELGHSKHVLSHKQVSAQNEGSALSLLEYVAREMYKAFPQTEFEDTRLLMRPKVKLSERQKAAIRFRRSDKWVATASRPDALCTSSRRPLGRCLAAAPCRAPLWPSRARLAALQARAAVHRRADPAAAGQAAAAGGLDGRVRLGRMGHGVVAAVAASEGDAQVAGGGEGDGRGGERPGRRGRGGARPGGPGRAVML